MKKALLFYLSGILLSVTAGAQKHSYGLRAGLNLIPIEEETVKYGKVLKPGWNAGLYYNFKFNDHFSLQSEVYYTFKATSYSRTDTSSLLDILEMFGDFNSEDFEMVNGYVDLNVYKRTTARVNMNYFEMPVMFSYTPFNFLSINAGVYGSYLASASSFIQYKEDIPLLESTHLVDSFPEAGFIINFFYPANDEPQNSRASSKNRYSSLDFGIIGGFSLKTENDIMINFRYTRGFWNYTKETFSTEGAHSAFQLVLSYPLSNFVIHIKKNSAQPRIE